jgi:uncharacterized protein (TIGR03435 family)
MTPRFRVPVTAETVRCERKPAVKRSPPAAGMAFRMNETKGTLTYVNVPLRWIIRSAFRVQDSQISGPDWLNDERYDVQATYPADTPAPQRGTMLQNLLATRFKLAVHHETKDVSAYRLVVDTGGPRMAKVAPPE